MIFIENLKRVGATLLIVLSSMLVVFLFLGIILFITKEKITVLEMFKEDRGYKVIYQEESMGRVYSTYETFNTLEGAKYFIELNDKEFLSE